MKITFKFLFIFLLFSANSCKQKPTDYASKVSDANAYHACINKLTEVIIYDIFSPPVASRIYSYATLAGYEAMAQSADYQSVSNKINGYKDTPKPEKDKEYCYPLAGIKAFQTVARGLTFSVEKYDELEKNLYKKFEDAGVPDDVMERSMAYGESVGKNVLGYAKSDNYPQTRGLRYSLQNKPGTWTPTPPQYADAIEPNWGKIRSMTMDSSAQFLPPPPPAYNLAKGSPFMKEVRQVYEINKNLTEEQKRIAWFWDDNAFVMNVIGHVNFANKKMTPGGHWLAITQTVCKQQKTDLMKTAAAYMLVSFALRDAFIECWEVKYRYHKIRPETVINASLDPKWQPFLQTPPFPEYSGGHSTISGASAAVLTSLFGENVAFIDSTEFKFGHGVGSFKSIKEAAAQASISRVYGGIHFQSACVEGLKVGDKIGKLVLEKVKMGKK